MNPARQTAAAILVTVGALVAMWSLAQPGLVPWSVLLPGLALVGAGWRVAS